MHSDSPLSDDTYCNDLTRRFDRDRYLCTLFADSDHRPYLLALYAFNIEIAGTRETVSQPMIGHMRLKWWYDALDGIYRGQPPAHQVAVPLSRAVADGRIERSMLENLIEARVADLNDNAPNTLADLIEYADQTSGALVQMALSVLGVKGEGAMKAGHHVGIAYALLGLIRALPVNISRRYVFLPTEICQRTGLDVGEMLDRGLKLGPPAELIEAITHITGCAADHLAQARKLKKHIPRRGLSAVLPGVIAGRYLKQLASLGNDPFRIPQRQPGPGVSGMLGLAWAAAKGEI